MATSYADWAARFRVPLHFLLAALLLGVARPTGALLVAGAALVATGLAVRAWAAGHLRRELPLVTSGPYAYLRHPLYFGSAFVLAGFALSSGRLWMGAVVGLYFVLLFVPVLRREEVERRARAPELYADYASRVPMLLPLRRAYSNPAANPARFDAQVFRANREWRATVGCAVLLALLYLKMKGVF